MTRMIWRAAAVGSLGCALTAAVGCAPTVKAGDADIDYNVTRATPAKPSANGAAVNAPAQPAGTVQVPDDAKDYGDMPTPPKDARYTIVCQAYSGPDHAEQARQVRDVLRRATPLHKWYVVHEADNSKLYYGFYRTVGRDKDDMAEGERAKADLDAIRELHNSNGVRLFSQCLPVPIDAPDPAANKAWDITRSGGYWSLEVATFKDSADRKERAVEAVADARKQGIPAFYYHGDHASSVLIGSWPKAAATLVTPESSNPDPDSVVVVTPAALPDAVRQKMGSNVEAVTPHVEILDPSLAETMRQYPDHSVNGFTLMKPDAHGQPTNVAAEHSALVMVPAAATHEDAVAADPSLTTSTPGGADAAQADKERAVAEGLTPLRGLDSK